MHGAIEIGWLLQISSGNFPKQTLVLSPCRIAEKKENRPSGESPPILHQLMRIHRTIDIPSKIRWMVSEVSINVSG
jgi:hypothetical protein